MPNNLIKNRRPWQKKWLGTLASACLLLAVNAFGAVPLPLELHENDTTLNYTSIRGVPISHTPGNPPGSDGRQPQDNESGSNLPATARQFQSIMFVGGTVAPRRHGALAASQPLQAGSTPFSTVVGREMQLPNGQTADGSAIFMRRALVGTPYLSRQISFYFGSVIPVPSTDEDAALLTSIVKEQYWLPEPYSTNNHANDRYYWSPHAQKVYAIQPGPITITWKKATPLNSLPPGADPTQYVSDGGHFFRLYSVTYIISGSAAKPPRKIYWTENSFQQIGKLVNVPAARVGAVQIVYNSNFPQTVPQEFVGPGQSNPGLGTTNAPLPELRTLWFNQLSGNIHAYNKEGRVFLELLGDLKPDGKNRISLGFEIVDVYQQVNPADLTIELGERVTPPAPYTVADLAPEPIPSQIGTTFAYQHSGRSADMLELYAVRETQNLNDFLVHWMEKGLLGLEWPSQFARYQFIWPNSVSKYSHFVRPLAATDAEAQLTAVPLATANTPAIQYQDDPGHPRAKLTPETKFYTFLDSSFPTHRTLLRYTSGDSLAFERVFSWLDGSLKTTNFSGSVATNLVEFDSASGQMNWSTNLAAPRVVSQNAFVGQRIAAPVGEIGDGLQSPYLAGHIRQTAGTLFNPGAYRDPFEVGFEFANLGAIIPVNSIPGKDQLEVWWFRMNQADTAKGFVPVYWPSVIGRYNIQWPIDPPEIVLASNQGSAASGYNDPLAALGNIYLQNNSAQPGYNPNEEHALMQGGTAYALRDDLNVTNGVTMSSLPYVLVDYKAADGRPAMAAYKVLREKPEAGWVFDYIVKAGSLLQPPMPLGLLPPPVTGTGESVVNFNREVGNQGGDLPVGWNEARDSSGLFSHYKQFTLRDRKHGFWVYRGLHAGLPDLAAGTYNTNTALFAPLTSATAIIGQSFAYTIHASRESQYLSLSVQSLPEWMHVDGLSLKGSPAPRHAGNVTLQILVRDIYDGSEVTLSLPLVVSATGLATAQGPLTFPIVNRYTGTQYAFTDRPPFLASAPASSNSFTMRFYYKTLPGFAWPAETAPPPTGSIVPYLRPFNQTNNSYTGEAASSATASLEIVYRPVWPKTDPVDASKPLPVLAFGQTLTEPVEGLPGVRSFKTANLLYQQSIASDFGKTNDIKVSAVLHDPTRQKVSDLAQQGLSGLPSGVNTDYYQGKYYFPNLPPHLVTRVFYDPNVGTSGSLILQGEFKNEIAGEKYVLLNVLRDSDLAAVKGLCPQSDSKYASWNQLVDMLLTRLEWFHENPNVPGTFITRSSSTNLIASTSGGVSIVNADLVNAENLALVANDNIAVDSYALSAVGPGSGYITIIENNGTAFTQPGDPVAMHILKVGGSLYTGELKVIASPNPLSEQVTFQHTGDMAGRASAYEYEWRIAAPVDGLPPVGTGVPPYLPLTSPTLVTGLNRYTIGGAGIQALSDNYVILRYRPTSTNHPLYNLWSDWTAPQLSEGWIKRVLAGINPFNQRTSDLFNNPVATDGSIIQEAGHRWEGDIALNADTLNNFGLIEIYETVLRRGRSLSIEANFNYGPANDALLLAAGYLNDLYMMLGNEAWADAANPTIGIGTKDTNFGEIATALFAFKGQVPSLMEEELSLMRGRDDALLPNIQTAPFYNRLIWNYTRGIDSGQVIYSLNYDIKDVNRDGVEDAADAANLFPQAHGDAYGHYLTALKGYYSLLINPNFDWVARIEAVTVLGQPVSVDYTDERKFAAAAAALSRAGQKIVDLTWRHDYQPRHDAGWSYMGATRVNTARSFIETDDSTNNVARHWGVDHWATRVGVGTYVNWVVANSILPAVDPNPEHEGIQEIDRSTVPELEELPATGQAVQMSMDNAEGGLTPLGLAEGSLAFDINPNQVVGSDSQTHFDQIYLRARLALRNALTAFDDAKDVTSQMRSAQDSVDEFRFAVYKQEHAYTNALIEIYGTPYPSDIGPGKTYPQGYGGPDFIHSAYVDNPQLTLTNVVSLTNLFTVSLDTKSLLHERLDAFTVHDKNAPFGQKPKLIALQDVYADIGAALPSTISYTFDLQGNFQKPAGWTGRRASPGKVQQAVERIYLARNAAMGALHHHQQLAGKLNNEFSYFVSKKGVDDYIHSTDVAVAATVTAIQGVKFVAETYKVLDNYYNDTMYDTALAATTLIPKVEIFGLADGGDIMSPATAIIWAQYAASRAAVSGSGIIIDTLQKAFTVAKESYIRLNEAINVDPLKLDLENQRMIVNLDSTLNELQGTLFTINQRIQELENAMQAYRSVVAEGERLLEERHIFRQRSAALVQGYRTRDAAFRLFRNEQLERYKTLFEVASRYVYLAASAYDYETGLLNGDQGRQFVNRILNARALGVVRNGEPQYAGSDTGDPGLSGLLAEMQADWHVVKSRLGLNNPDAYGTTASLRVENFRILPGTNGLANWQDLLRQSRRANLLDDEDVRRYCMQIAPADGSPVPGILLEFSTTISPGYNLFGQPLAAGDSYYSASSFATKIFGVGVALEGYRGMNNPSANSAAVNNSGGTSPADPGNWFLDPLALAATPYIYLVPVGDDAMRAPALGDANTVRTWTVNDVAIPLPFNIGGAENSSKSFYTSNDSLTEPLFSIRKHQAFRPVSDTAVFSTSLYGHNGTLQRSQYTNNRLVARSVWNTRWKLVIPGNALLQNHGEGLDRFIKTVTDVKVHFVTYSASGN